MTGLEPFAGPMSRRAAPVAKNPKKIAKERLAVIVLHLALPAIRRQRRIARKELRLPEMELGMKRQSASLRSHSHICLSFLAGSIGCATTAANVSPLSSAEQIVARHIAAIGGEEKAGSIRSLQAATIVSENGTLHPLFVDRHRPNLLRVRMMHNGELVFTEVYTGTQSWEGAPGKEACKPDSAAMAATRHAAEQFDDPLISAISRAVNTRLAGLVQLGGRNLYQIDITQRDGSRGSYYVDVETSMLSRVRSVRPLHPGQAGRLIELVLDDYRPVSGVLFPFRSVERDVESGDLLTVAMTLWAEANVPIGPGAYAMPASCR